MACLNWNIKELEAKAQDIRNDIVTLLANSATGHTGGSLSSTDFSTALFFNELDLDPNNPSDAGNDFWHFSIGHVTPLIYSLMAERGYFALRELLGFRSFEGILQGHPSAHDVPGIRVSAGSLGQGLSLCCGVAHASKMDNHPRRTWCIMGDGEQQEGSVWEAAMSAVHYKLDNLIAIIDVNRLQIDGSTKEVMGIEPLADKYKAFGWEVIEIDGHDLAKILSAFELAKSIEGKPTIILADTIMGKGFDFMEDDHTWHGRPPTIEQADIALGSVNTSYEEWRKRLQNG